MWTARQTFVAQTNVAGANGTFSIAADGSWTYTANSAFDNLNVGQTVSDTFTVASADGTTSTVKVTINGTNDAAVVIHVATVSLAETNAPLTTGGTLTVTDVDSAADVSWRRRTWRGRTGRSRSPRTGAGRTRRIRPLTT